MSVPHLRILMLGGILIRVASGPFRRRVEASHSEENIDQMGELLPFLQKAKTEVEDLFTFTDLADGSKLLKLFEIVSGEKPGKNKMPVHRLKTCARK